jgi:heme A synthase
MALRWLHAAAAVAFVAAILVQVFLAGAAIANLGGSGDFATHIEFGYTWVGLAGLALVVTGIVARRPRRDVGMTLGLLALYVIQTALPALRDSVPSIAALHPVNAMLLFALAAWYARRAWSATRAEVPTLAVAAAPGETGRSA